jgi:hypothetical protein
MSYEPRDYLRHILVRADYLVGRSAKVTADAFMADETLRRAFSRSELRTRRPFLLNSSRYGEPFWPDWPTLS